MSDWRVKMIDALVEIGKGSGILAFEREKVLALMRQLADRERGKPEGQRTGFAYAMDNYAPKALEQLLTRVSNAWGTPPPAMPELAVAPSQPTVTPRLASHGMVCTIAVKMKKQPKPPAEFAASMQAELNRIFENDSVAAIQQAVHVHDEWWDLLVSYQLHLAKIYEAVFKYPDVQDAVTKPAADFGKRTIATMR